MWHVYTSLPGQIHSSWKSLFQLSLFSSRERSAAFKLLFLLCLRALAYWFSFLHLFYSISVIAYEYFFFVLCEYFFFFLQCCHDSITWEPWGCLSLSSMTAQPERGQGSQRVGSVLASSCLGVPSHKSATKSDKSPFLRLSYQSVPSVSISLHLCFMHRLSVDLGYAETRAGLTDLKCGYTSSIFIF